MKKLTIYETDVYLDSIGPEQGKIVLSGPAINASYYWGAMGCGLEDFILGISEDYFCNKLCPTIWVFNLQTSVRYLRSEIRNKIPWYKYTEFQKELREELRAIEMQTDMSESDFVNSLSKIEYNVDFDLIPCKTDREEMIEFFTSEPWYHSQQTKSSEANFLIKFHAKLKAEIKKSKQLLN